MRVAIGIDPDLHSTAVVFVAQKNTGQLVLLDSFLIRVGADLKRAEASAAMSVACAEDLSIYEKNPADRVAVAVVEGQKAYGSNPYAHQDIVHLAQVAGACHGAVSRWAPKVLMPFPQEWKGQVPKQIHQGRIYKQMGWQSEPRGTLKNGYAIPLQPYLHRHALIKNADWKHLGDAIGLALWGLEQL